MHPLGHPDGGSGSGMTHSAGHASGEMRSAAYNGAPAAYNGAPGAYGGAPGPYGGAPGPYGGGTRRLGARSAPACGARPPERSAAEASRGGGGRRAARSSLAGPDLTARSVLRI
ncbi:hypothetical protein GCM10009578_019240 [Streptomyces rhizosphaericus]